MPKTSTQSDVVAEQIAAVRRLQGFSREELAGLCRDLGLPEMTANAVTNIETGRRQGGQRRRQVTVDELVVIAAALGVPPVLLLSASTDVLREALSALDIYMDAANAQHQAQERMRAAAVRLAPH